MTDDIFWRAIAPLDFAGECDRPTSYTGLVFVCELFG